MGCLSVLEGCVFVCGCSQGCVRADSTEGAWGRVGGLPLWALVDLGHTWESEGQCFELPKLFNCLIIPVLSLSLYSLSQHSHPHPSVLLLSPISSIWFGVKEQEFCRLSLVLVDSTSVQYSVQTFDPEGMLKWRKHWGFQLEVAGGLMKYVCLGKSSSPSEVWLGVGRV